MSKNTWLIIIGLLVGGEWLVAQNTKVWTLQEMIDYAAENNLTIQQNAINNQLLENNITAAQRQKLPNVNAQVSNDLILGVQGVPIVNSNQQFLGESDGYQLYQNTLGLSSSMVLFNKGQFNLNKEKAELDYEVGNLNLKQLINDISLDIVNQYLTLLLNQEIASVAREQWNTSKQVLEQNEILYKGGAIPLSQVYESRAQVAQDKQQLTNAEISVNQAKFNLSQLLQLQDYKAFDAEIISPPEQLPPNFFDLNEIVSYAFDHQPRIIGAEVNVESMEKDIEIAKTNYWPTVTANYQVGTNYRDYISPNVAADALMTQWWDNHVHTFSVGVNIPIFNRFLTDLSVENAQVNVALAEQNLAIEKQSLYQEIQQAYFQVENSYAQFLAAEETMESAQLAYDFAQKSYDAGRTTIYDLNISRNNWFNAKSQMLQAKYNYVFSIKVLDFYAGKPLTF